MQNSLTFSVVMAALALPAFLAPASAQAQSPLQVVMSGLDNPYGLAFGPDGGLYVAEAGTGNSGAASGSGFVAGNGEQVYFGDTGAEATGLSSLAFDSSGSLYGVFGFGGQEAQRNQLVMDVLTQTGAGSTNAGDLGQVVRLNAALNTVTPLVRLGPV